MSIDLAVWSSQRFKLPAQLPKAIHWQQFGEEFSYDGDGWQVLVQIDEEEPDVSIKESLPDAAFVAYVVLEPISADPEGYDLLEEVVRALAREGAGVWTDPDGTVYRHNEGSFH